MRENMGNRGPLLMLLGIVLSLASCAQGPNGPGRMPGPRSVGVSLTPDSWGHRPGPRGFHTVIIDAGHGGRDSGATSPITGNREKDLALDTSRRLANLLRGRFRVILMREGDAFIDLDERVNRASPNAGAILVSIHYNSSGSSSIRGPETYYWRVDSYSLARRIQRQIENVSPVESGNLGLKRRRLRLTRNPHIPSVLVECGYLSNPGEAQLCTRPDYRESLARAIAQAIQDQAHAGDAGMGPLPPPLYQPLSRPTDPAGS